jgi:adenosylcobinamide kinase/adenosylcobinamide-phosphate guanylyltransferase
MLTLITGGTRSGKSGFATKLAAATNEAVLYVATWREDSATHADEMAMNRIARHKQSRPGNWRTVILEQDATLQTLAHAPERVVLLDCIGLWVGGTLFDNVGARDEMQWSDIEARAEQLMNTLVCAVDQHDGRWFVVTNEVGSALTPDNAVGRAFADAMGRANQTLMKHCHQAWLLVAGASLQLK